MNNKLKLRPYIDTTERENPQIAVALWVDQQPLIAFEKRNLAVDLRELLRSQSQDGEYFIVTCACGDAGCAGIWKGVQVRHDSVSVH